MLFTGLPQDPCWFWAVGTLPVEYWDWPVRLRRKFEFAFDRWLFPVFL